MQVNRKELVKALQQIVSLTHGNRIEVLRGVKLQSDNGRLTLIATDLESTLQLTIETLGTEPLPACIVDAADLLARVKKESAVFAHLELADADQLTVNGGKVEHKLPTMLLADYPIYQNEAGLVVHLAPTATKYAISSAIKAMARENTRYALRGVNITGKAGRGYLQVQATDGRRLANIDLPATCPVDFACIIRDDAAKLLLKLLGKKPMDVALILPVAGNSAIRFMSTDGWELNTYPIEGKFPDVEDFLNLSGEVWTVNRAALLAAVEGVGMEVAKDVKPAILIDAFPGRIDISAGQSHSKVYASGTAAKGIGFNPRFVADALSSLTVDTVELVINNRNHPAMIRTADRSSKWIIMPISMDVLDEREKAEKAAQEAAV